MCKLDIFSYEDLMDRLDLVSLVYRSDLRGIRIE